MENCMNQNKKMAALAALLILFALLLPSCGKKHVYADGFSCADLMETALSQIPIAHGYKAYGEEQLQYYPEVSSLSDDHSIFYSALSEDINELGIFHTETDSDGDALDLVLERYLEETLRDQEAFIGSYAAEELPKLREAEVRRFGSYTVYAILSESDRHAVFEALDALLTKK